MKKPSILKVRKILYVIIGAEPVLRVKRKGRTGFKPSGLRDELPDLPVPFVN